MREIIDLSVLLQHGRQPDRRRNFTPAEVSAKKATFALPKSAAGKSVEFYAMPIPR
ncbi:MAG: hypothetical protein ACLR8Y_10780 [Alistipes indistinctus]